MPKANDGLLTIVEEVPGLIVAEDMSEKLGQDLFWPSFNVVRLCLHFVSVF